MKTLQIYPRLIHDAQLLGHFEKLGGAERYVFNLCKAQRELGVDATLLLFGKENYETHVLGIPVLIHKAKSVFSFINGDFNPLPTDFGRFLGELKKNQIIHVHNLSSDVALLVKLNKSVFKTSHKVFVTDHGWKGLTLMRPLLWFCKRFKSKLILFDGLLTQTTSSFKEYECFAKVCEPIYGGVDIEKFRPLGVKRKNQVCFSGRIAPHKGVEGLIEAVSLSKEKPRVVIAGSAINNPYLLFLRELANKLRVETDFVLGPSDDALAEIYSSSKILVLPSVYTDIYGKYHPNPEGFGLVLVEAMACELPVVASKISAISEVVDDNRTGYLVPPRDIGYLCERLDLLLRDHKLNRKLGIAGRRKVLERFTWSHVARRAMRVYEGY